MEIYQYIDEILEVSDPRELKRLLDNNYILVNSYIRRDISEGCKIETLYYSLGHINMLRNFTK